MLNVAIPLEMGKSGQELDREMALQAGVYAGSMTLQPPMLGVDIGDRRLGVALSDALGIARPLLTMGPSGDGQRLRNLARLVRRHGAVGIVAGNPLHMSGDTSPQAAKVQAFVTALRGAVQVPVYLQDERLSSIAANELMDRLGYPRGPGRKGLLDQYAAVVILQDWMDAREGQREASARDEAATGSL